MMKAVRFLGVGFLAFFITFFVLGECRSADKYPARPIQIVIGFAPGDTDNGLRPFIEKMVEYLGQPMPFVYKPGAAGSVGSAFVASAKPDGYTLVGTSQTSITIVPHTQQVSYTWESFAPVCQLNNVAYLWAVNSNSRWKTIKEFVADAKKDPGKLTYSSAGTFVLPHLCGEIFAREAGVKFNFIPSQGSAPAVTALLGGHLDAVSTTSTAVVPHVLAGTLRGLAVFTKERVKAIPDVPTFLEMGYPVSVAGITGLLAPKGTPKEVIDTLNDAAKKVFQYHEAFITEREEKLGLTPKYAGPEEYTAVLKYNNELFSKVIKDLKP